MKNNRFFIDASSYLSEQLIQQKLSVIQCMHWAWRSHIQKPPELQAWTTRNWAQQKKWEQWPCGGLELAPGQFRACRSSLVRREGKPWISWGAHSNHEKVLWQGQKDQEIVWQSPDEVCVECRYPDCQTYPWASYSLWRSAYPQYSALPLRRSETTRQVCSLETPPNWENDVDKDGLFAIKYKHRTPEQWGKVMLSDDTKIRILSVVSRVIRWPIGSCRYTIPDSRSRPRNTLTTSWFGLVSWGMLAEVESKSCPKKWPWMETAAWTSWSTACFPSSPSTGPATTSRKGPPYCKSRRSCSTWRTRSWRS